MITTTNKERSIIDIDKVGLDDSKKDFKTREIRMNIWQHQETQGASRDARCQCLPPPQGARGRGVCHRQTTTTSSSWLGWGKGE